MTASAPDSLTVVRAHARGKRLAKLIRPGEIVPYDAVLRYDFHTVAFDGLAQLHAIVADLLGRPDCAVVRGAIRDPRRARRVRRLLYADRKTGDEATLDDAPRGRVELDVDGIPAPDGLDVRDLPACGEVARRLLPEAFQGVACLVQATAGHGIKPGLRLRLWFLLARPLTGAEAQRWLRDAPGLDLSTLRAAQLIYTAAPVFEGVADPLPHRLALLPGAERVLCPTPAELEPPRRPAADPSRLATPASGDRYARAALMRAGTAIATAPVDSRHPTAVAEAWSLARLVVAGLLTEGEVERVVDGALQQAGKPAGEGAAIAAWAVSKRADAGNAPRGGQA